MLNSNCLNKIAVGAALCVLFRFSQAQIPVAAAVKCHQPPRLDGNLEDAGWTGAPILTAFKDQYTNRPVDDQTTVRIVYDDAAIYVAYHCHDSRPEQIVGREITPEAQFNGEDTVSFTIDPYHTREGSSVSKFTVNAINTRSEYIAGGHSSKAEWRGIWDSFVKRVPDGYVVEMRIPWQILPYPAAKNPIDMDMNFDRYQPRSKTSSQWAWVGPTTKPELFGIWQGVAPPAHDNRSRIQFLAYDAPTVSDHGFANREGLDVRYSISKEQTALLSITPDFINIEQQIAGVNFVHTERFLSDARPFFTEGGDYFNPVGDFEAFRPFYSHRIGAIDAGSKFYGQVGPDAKLGVMAVEQSDGSTATFSNYRWNKRETFNQNVYLSTFDGQNIHDQMLGTRTYKRWGNYFVQLNEASENNGRNTESAGDFAVGYRGPKLFTEVMQQWVDPSFSPPLAYVAWTNRRGTYNYNEYFDTLKSGPLHDFDVSLYVPDFYSANHRVQERGYQFSAQGTTRTDQSIGFSRNVVDYATGTDDNVDLSYTFNASNRFRQFGVEYLFGRQAGQPSRFLDLKGSVRVLRRIDLGLEQSVLDFATPAHQTIGTIGWQIDARKSLTGRYVDTNGYRNFFLSFQSAGWTGMEVYVILGDPNALTFSRQLSLKFVWAF